jgi:hypothetical protein
MTGSGPYDDISADGPALADCRHEADGDGDDGDNERGAL